MKLLLTILSFLLLLISCNVEEIFIINPSLVVEDAILESDEEENTPNNEDTVPQVEAVDDSAITTVNNAIAVYTYVNDKNLPKNIIVSNTEASNGVLSVNNNNTPSIVMDDTMVYTPNAGFSGRDSFEYTVCDAANSENCDTALVSIVIENNPINTDEVGGVLKAFPSAEGAGANTTGGRGGIIVRVTTLEELGSGSLYEAINGDGITFDKNTPRTVVFDVSGTITWNKTYWGAQVKNLTIAGQTAPQGGITLEVPGFNMNRCENVIIRYMRFVNTAYFIDNSFKAQGLNISGGNKMIVDHISIRYTWNSLGFAAQDSNDAIDGQGEITLQRSIIGDCATGALVGGAVTYPRSSYGGTNTVHHNLFAHVDHRFPNVAGDSEVNVIENIVYNFRSRLSTHFNNSKSNVINNTYKSGLSSIFIKARNRIGDYVNTNPVEDIPKVYFSGNKINRLISAESYLKTDVDMQGLFLVWGPDNHTDLTEIETTTEALFRVSIPFPDLGIPVNKLGTDESYISVLSDVGANKYLNKDGTVGLYLDVMDTHYINDTKNGTIWSGGTEYVNKTDQNALIYPTLPTNIRSADYDTDIDGMPDFWEMAKFGSLIRTGIEDFDGDGYTDLEEFINLVDLF